METTNLCRCCLVKGLHKDLYLSYKWFDKDEVYSDMIWDCFNINLPKSEHTNSICEQCIKSLRSAHTFKQQVLRSDDELTKKTKNDTQTEPKQLEIKLEPHSDGADDSDDYFLASAIGEVTIKRIKVESDTSKKKESKQTSKSKKSSKKIPEGWKSPKIKTLVNRLATSMKSCDTPDIKIVKKESKPDTRNSRTKRITIVKNLSDNINLKFINQDLEKVRHRENLVAVLQYSNATPFKTKSLLGYLCGYCEKPYPDPADLKIHTDIEHAKERLNFKTDFDLFEYIVHMDITDLICTECNEKMDNLGVLKEHLVKKHNLTIHNDIKDHLIQFKLKKGDVYDCAMCSSTYETFKTLKQHMNKHYNNYICSICNAPFATRRSLTSHKGTHVEGSFKCNYCDKIFASRTKQHYHEKMKHLGTRHISNCPYCNEQFRSYYQRNQHLVKVHNTEAQYKCNICDKGYILKSLLMYHIKKNHLMERNSQCTECGYRFFSNKALKAHMVKHTGEKNYACTVCHKSYARKYTLREHMRIHNNDRRFKCDVCGMTFVQKCSLKSHLLSNHGISLSASDITSVSEIQENISVSQ